MAFEFNKGSSVLYYSPKPHARWEKRRYVLWPAWAYRVVAPRKRARKLNVFQRAVLGLCMAGIVKYEVVGEHLDVHKDLAAFILKELMDMGYVDSQGFPTESGRKTLEEDSVDSHEMVTGFVFQDPWTGDLWPRFVSQLTCCELSYRDNGFPDLLLGTKGNHKRWNAFMVLPGDVPPLSRPDAKDIIEAVSRGARARKMDGFDDDDEIIDNEEVSDRYIPRVSFIEEKPQAVFLTSFLYVPEQGSGVADWYICDPFGFGKSSSLRRKYETVMKEKTGLLDAIRSLIGEDVDGGYEEQKQWFEMIRTEARLEVERRFMVNIRSYGFYEALVDFESNVREIRLAGSSCPNQRIKGALRSGSNVLEACFKEMTLAWPLGNVWEKVYVKNYKLRWVPQQERNYLKSIYESAFQSAGFDTPVPDSLINIKPGQIRSVAEYGDSWRLRPSVTATALRASGDPSHPFRKIAGHDPRILEAIHASAEIGGAAGHTGDRDVTVDDVEKQMERVFSIVELFVKYLPEPGVH